MKLNPWIVAGGLLLGYALWRAYGPRPASAADDQAETGASDETITGPLQAFSNGFGAVAAVGGFDDAAGDLADQDELAADQDQLDGDSLGAF